MIEKKEFKKGTFFKILFSKNVNFSLFKKFKKSLPKKDLFTHFFIFLY